jgi:3-methyl-2-oxobutanoate hydroxymethyltransferase
MSNEEMLKQMYSPIPKMSMAVKGRKTIHYLQKLKDEGKPIVQHCPSMLGPIFTMAAGMAGVDICRLPPSSGRCCYRIRDHLAKGGDCG